MSCIDLRVLRFLVPTVPVHHKPQDLINMLRKATVTGDSFFLMFLYLLVLVIDELKWSLGRNSVRITNYDEWRVGSIVCVHILQCSVRCM